MVEITYAERLMTIAAHSSCSARRAARREFCDLLASGEQGVRMPKFVIEREIPGLGKLSEAELQTTARKSVAVLKELGPGIQWLHSYVTGDKLYCIYIAPNEDMIREHAQQGGFPANKISEIKTVIDPTTAE